MKRPQVDDLGGEGLPAREGEQLRGQFGAARDPVQRDLHAPLRGCVAGDIALEQVQIAADDMQQIVEVVRDAARQIADRLHLLAVAQRGLGLDQLCGARLHPLLERPVELRQGRAALRASLSLRRSAAIIARRSVMSRRITVAKRRAPLFQRDADASK